jgi:hypothetical protein
VTTRTIRNSRCDARHGMPVLNALYIVLLCSGICHSKVPVRVTAATTSAPTTAVQLPLQQPPPVYRTGRAIVTSCLSRTEAATVLNTHALPVTQKTARMQLATKSSDGVNDGCHVLLGSDPSLYDTYGEFPLSSLDILLDRFDELRQKFETDDRSACGDNINNSNNSGEFPKRRMNVIDLGSGCGRIAIYMALTRPGWNVHGIEQSASLHLEALHALQRTAVHDSFFVQPHQHESADSSTLFPEKIFSPLSSCNSHSSELTLHHGPASLFSSLLHSADLIFSYSTAFESSGFSKAATALILSQEWNDLLSPPCSTNAATNHESTSLWCITTDKALDSRKGWEIVDRVDVDNPEVIESTGFIQRFGRDVEKVLQK